MRLPFGEKLLGRAGLDRAASVEPAAGPEPVAAQSGAEPEPEPVAAQPEPVAAAGRCMQPPDLPGPQEAAGEARIGRLGLDRNGQLAVAIRRASKARDAVEKLRRRLDDAQQLLQAAILEGGDAAVRAAIEVMAVERALAEAQARGAALPPDLLPEAEAVARQAWSEALAVEGRLREAAQRAKPSYVLLREQAAGGGAPLVTGDRILIPHPGEPPVRIQPDVAAEKAWQRASEGYDAWRKQYVALRDARDVRRPATPEQALDEAERVRALVRAAEKPLKALERAVALADAADEARRSEGLPVLRGDHE